MTTPLGSVVVIGGGTMGAGIAQSLIEVGTSVAVVEPDVERARAARDRVAAGLRERFKHEANSEDRVQELLALLAVRVGMAVPAGEEQPVLVVEAVLEDLDLKAEILGAAEVAFSGAAVLASNTSSLSIDALAGRLVRPGSFLGMHFFNPVPRSALVELEAALVDAQANDPAEDRLGPAQRCHVSL